jgi:RNA 3'-phosphate cyclase
MILLDGSHGEGGGQIVRNAIALSLLTARPFSIRDIRKGRRKPGLKAQHLACLRAVGQLSDSRFEGAKPGSEWLEFHPGPVTGRCLSLDIGTAGSITLLLQSVLLPLLFAGTSSRLNLRGGTDVAWSMPADYFKDLFLPHLRRYADFECTIVRRGYYPRGGGEMEVRIEPRLRPGPFGALFSGAGESGSGIDLTALGRFVRVEGVSHASAFLKGARVAERQAQGAKAGLRFLEVPVDIRISYSESLCPGSGIFLKAVYGERDEGQPGKPSLLGADCLGEKGKPAEIVGREAAEALVKVMEREAPVDDHLQDNLIPFLALFGGAMRVPGLTGHTRSSISVCEQFLKNRFRREGDLLKV